MEKRIAPKSVAIIGLGPSRQDYISDVANLRCDVPWEEVWAMNSGVMTFRHDLGFFLDDLKVIESRFPQMAAVVKRSTVPIVTSTKYDDFPNTIAYPYDEILTMVGIPNVMCNTGPMALAYAYWIGVKKIYLFGFDYTYPGVHISEFGGQALAFLIGMAGRFQASVELTPKTSLLGNVHARWTQTDKGIEMDWPFYGLARNVEFYDKLVNLGDK